MKSENRVPKEFRKGTEDWEYFYNMLLPDGLTCFDCKHASLCHKIYGADSINNKCDFYPNRFQEKRKDHWDGH